MKSRLDEWQRHNLKQMNVLVAEDDESVLASMRTILGHYFRDVTFCSDGLSALEHLQKEVFDLAILDIRMPGMDGLEVAETIRGEENTTPILILTSYEAVEPLRRAVPLGLVDYMVKPLGIAAFETALQTFLSRRSPQKQERVMLNRRCYLDRNRQALVRTDLPEYAAPLSANEYAFLELLIANKGRIVHLEEIDREVYKGEMTPQAIRNLLLRLREKLTDKETIVTHRGIGYAWLG